MLNHLMICILHHNQPIGMHTLWCTSLSQDWSHSNCHTGRNMSWPLGQPPYI